MASTVKKTNRSIILDLLNKYPEGLTVTEISGKAKLSEPQIRNIVSGGNYDMVVVSLENGKFALGKHSLKNVKFRYTPTKDEIRLGILQAEDEHVDYLRLGNRNGEPTVVYERNAYKLKVVRKPKTVNFNYFKGFERFYKKTNFKFGDDLIFEIVDVEKLLFEVGKVSKIDRQEDLIYLSNKILTNMIYNFLNHSVQKREWTMFLSQRILPRLKNFQIPPDKIEKAVSVDPRLFCFRQEPFDRGELGDLMVGIKKYAIFMPDGSINWAVIEKDKFGKYGFCEKCGIPLRWSLKTGWIHPEEDVENYEAYREDIGLDPLFFEFDKQVFS